MAGLAVPSLLAIEIATGSMLGPRFKSDRFYVRNFGRGKWEQTYSARPYRRQARGKLMVLRLAHALSEGRSLREHGFDPGRNTSRVIDALDFYKEHGVLAITVGLQSENPSVNKTLKRKHKIAAAKNGKDKFDAGAFHPDGSFKEGWMNRLESLLKAADQKGMIVCLVYFHPDQDQTLEGPRAIAAAARNVTQWLIDKNFRNVVINVAEEWDLSGEAWDHARFIPENIDRLIEAVRERFNHADYTLPIGASSSGRMSYPDSLAQVSDVVLLHGNGRTPGEKLSKLRQFRSTGRALWMVQDDNGRATTLANLKREKASANAVFRRGAGWGYVPWKQAHQFPFNYVPRHNSEFTDNSPEEQRDEAYFRAVLEHIAELVLKKPPRSVPKKKKR